MNDKKTEVKICKEDMYALKDTPVYVYIYIYIYIYIARNLEHNETVV